MGAHTEHRIGGWKIPVAREVRRESVVGLSADDPPERLETVRAGIVPNIREIFRSSLPIRAPGAAQDVVFAVEQKDSGAVEAARLDNGVPQPPEDLFQADPRADGSREAGKPSLPLQHALLLFHPLGGAL